MLDDFLEKLDPELRRILSEMQAADNKEDRVPVLIEPVRQPRIEPDLPPAEQLRRLEEEAPRLQKEIVRELEASGVPSEGITSMRLVNALAADLTIEQVARVARRDDVRILRFNGESYVEI